MPSLARVAQYLVDLEARARRIVEHLEHKLLHLAALALLRAPLGWRRLDLRWYRERGTIGMRLRQRRHMHVHRRQGLINALQLRLEDCELLLVLLDALDDLGPQRQDRLQVG